MFVYSITIHGNDVITISYMHFKMSGYKALSMQDRPEPIIPKDHLINSLLFS